MNIPSQSLPQEVQEALDALDQSLIRMVRFGLNSVKIRLRGDLESIIKDRETLREHLEEIEQLVTQIIPKSSRKSNGGVFLSMWSAIEDEIDEFSSFLHKKYSGDLRKSLANIQSRDPDFPTKYNKQILYLDSIISSKRIHEQILHFLVDLYNLCADEDGTESVLTGILEYVTVLSILPRFDMNQEDEKGRTPLMRIMENQREIEELYKNRDIHLIQTKLQKLATILQDGRTEIKYTREQIRRKSLPENQPGVVLSQQGETHNSVLRIVGGRLFEENLED